MDANDVFMPLSKTFTLGILGMFVTYACSNIIVMDMVHGAIYGPIHNNIIDVPVELLEYEKRYLVA